MKKMVFALLMCIMVSTFVFAGGGSEDTSGKTVVVVWTNQRHDMVYVQDAVDAYNETNTDNIVVELEIMTENYQNNLDLAFQSNQAPDIFRASGSSTVYLGRGMPIPLNDFLTQVDYDRYGNMIGVEGLNTVDGNIYSLPYSGACYRLVYNKEIFEKAGLDPNKPPQTIDEMVSYAKQITERLSSEGIYGMGSNMKSAYSALFRSLDVMAYASGVFPYDAEKNVYDFSGYGEIIERLRTMYTSGYYLPGAEGLDIDPMRVQFAQGNFGMYLSADWEVGVYADQFPTDIEWAAAPAPLLVAGDRHPVPTNSGGTGWSISNQSKNPEAAWKVLNSIFQDFDFQVGYAEGGFGTMITPEVVATAKPAERYGSEYFVPTEYDSVEAPPPHEAGLIVQGETLHEVALAAIMGNRSVEEAIRDLNSRYNAALDAAKSRGEF